MWKQTGLLSADYLATTRTSLDQGYLQFAKLTRPFPLVIFVTQAINTDDSRISGYHWFIMAVSLRLIPEPGHKPGAAQPGLLPYTL